MSTKRALVKQQVTYGEESWRESDEDLSVKRTLTKRVSFESHELSDSDSDVENSVGRINRTSVVRADDSLDGLFRGTSSKERESSKELAKGTSMESNASKGKGEQKPVARLRPTISPRRSYFDGHDPGSKPQQSSIEDNDDSSLTWPGRTKVGKEKHPVAPPRTSPRQNQGGGSSPDMASPRPVARGRPTLTTREGQLKLAQTDPGVDENEGTKAAREDGEFDYKIRKHIEDKPIIPTRRRKTVEETYDNTEGGHETFDSERIKSVSVEKPMAPSRRKKMVDETRDRGMEDEGYDHERTKIVSDIPLAPSRRKKMEETNEKHKEKDDRVYESEREKGLSEKPLAPSRRKMTAEDTREGSREIDDAGYKYERTTDFSEKPTIPFRKKKAEETHEVHARPQIPIIRTSTFEDNGSFLGNGSKEIEQYGNLRSYGQFSKVKGRPMISVTRSDSSEESEDEDDPGNVLYSKSSFGSLEDDRAITDAREKSVSTPPKPSPRGRSMVDDILKAHVKAAVSEEEVKPAKRPGSAPAMKKASSLETLSSKQQTPAKKGSGPNEHGAHRVQLKKSLTPQRPMSGKKGSLLAQLRQKAQADVTDNFEEHVPSVENVISTGASDRGFRRKDAWDAGGGDTRGVPKSPKSGPLKANQGIETMSKSPHPREAPIENWADSRSPSQRGSVTPKRSSSMTNLRGASPELWGGDTSGGNSQQSGLMDTASIRQAVFDEWRSRKNVNLKEEANKKLTEKKKQDEKEQEERERKKLAKRAFDSWSEMKQEKYKEVNAKKKELMEKELEKQTEKNLRARDAKKYFETWKSKKDEELKEKHHSKKKEEKEKKKREVEETQEKKKFSQKAFENWKSTKDEKIKRDIKKKRREEKDVTMKKEDEKYERSIQCAEKYQEWVENKGKPRRGPPPPTLTQRSWCPSGRKSGNCIPEKVGGVIQKPAPNRSRTMSGSYYFK